MSLYDLFIKDKTAALEYAFTEARERHKYLHSGRDCIFAWQSTASRSGTLYGSFKYIFKDELVHRKYEIELLDGAIGIFYTDKWFDPVSRTYEDK